MATGSTGSRSGYDSTADRAQGQTRKAAGKAVDDQQMEEEGRTQEETAAAKEREILEPWDRARTAEEQNPDQ